MHYTLHHTGWAENKTELSRVRRAVFIDEQQVPEELEWDEYDETCQHILVTDENDQAIATGRIKPDGHIGRMAVLKPHRKSGVGSAVLNALLHHAKKTGLQRVYLHAQTTAIPFYIKHGFVVCSEEFIDAGIPHKTMEKIITLLDPPYTNNMNTEHDNHSVLLPGWLRFGNTEHDQLLRTLADIHTALLDATQNALRTIRINTPDLESDLYDFDPFISALTGFIRDNRHANVQILVQNTRSAIQHGHRLIRLAQRLTSSIEIRKPASEDKVNTSSFIVFDNSSFIFKNNNTNSGLYNSQCKPRATKLLELFAPAWELAEQDIETRRLSI